MISIIIGALIMAGILFTINYARKRKLHIFWWQWILTFLGFGYTTFVLKMIESFLVEGAIKAALVMGVIFGFIAVLWGVLLARFIFLRKTK